MPFEAGHKKSTGRPKGSVNERNKKSEKIRSLLTDVLTEVYKSPKQVIARLERIEIEESLSARFKAEQQFIQYVVPKLQAMDITTDNEPLNMVKTTSAESMAVLKSAGIDLSRLKKASND